MQKLTLYFFDRAGALMSTSPTDEDDTPESRQAWTDWLNDPAVDHPVEGYDTFDFEPPIMVEFFPLDD